MRYHTKEYYRLLMALDSAGIYRPAIDKESYTDEDIDELYRQTADAYIEEARADHDAPPEYMIEVADDEGSAELRELRDRLFALSVEEYENRGPFDEEEARAEFEEMYNEALEEPDGDLPEWVREAVDPRLLAMELMPEKIYRKLRAEDEANEEKFDALDDEADEALEAIMKKLPGNYRDFAEILEDLEDSYVVRYSVEKGSEDSREEWLEILLTDWDEQGKETQRLLKFRAPEVIEDEGIKVRSWKDEDGDTESDCELLYGELYQEDGAPEVHLLFDNNGLKYLTFRCSEAVAENGGSNVECRI